MSTMRIAVVNPNTSAAMTERIAAGARAAATPGTQILAANPDDGPESIEGPYDGAIAVPPLLATIAALERSAHPPDGYVIACFDDTGLDAARCLARGPVVGIGEAGFHVASLVAERFAVVTTLARAIPTIEANLARYGLAARCAGVHAAEVAVLSLEHSRADARAAIASVAAEAIARGRAGAIVLGCAGMAGLADELAVDLGVPVVDGVAAAVRLTEALVGLGLRTSRAAGYAAPRSKRFAGSMARHAPGAHAGPPLPANDHEPGASDGAR